MNGQILGLVSAAPMIVNDWAISVEPIDGGHRLIARRGTEEQTIDIMNGLNGADGVSPTLTVTDAADGVVLTITDVNGTQTVTLPRAAPVSPKAACRATCWCARRTVRSGSRPRRTTILWTRCWRLICSRQ